MVLWGKTNATRLSLKLDLKITGFKCFYYLSKIIF